MRSNALPPLATREAKYLVSVNNLLDGEGDLECVKEVLRCTIETNTGTVALPYLKLQEM